MDNSTLQAIQVVTGTASLATLLMVAKLAFWAGGMQKDVDETKRRVTVLEQRHGHAE